MAADVRGVVAALSAGGQFDAHRRRDGHCAVQWPGEVQLLGLVEVEERARVGDGQAAQAQASNRSRRNSSSLRSSGDTP
jgi:hypothetical protein